MGKGTVNLTRHVSLTSVGMGSVSLASKGRVSLASKGMGTVSLASFDILASLAWAWAPLASLASTY